MSRQPRRERWYPRVGRKQLGRGKHSEWLMLIYKNFGAQRFVYTEARDMLLERYGIVLPQVTLSGWVKWSWLDAPRKTVEIKPRIVYQIPVNIRDTLEAIQTGAPRPMRTTRMPILTAKEFMEDWKKPWESSRR